tara:strand:- start:424 stop:1104 length:681 start_codon:yes stop_codon:yes gene_type:complete
LKSLCEIIALFLSKTPIALNKKSHEKMLIINKKSNLLSSFIPPIDKKLLDLKFKNKIKKLSDNHSHIFCTNAYDFSLDKSNNEVYGIFQLIKFFNNSKLGLVISDPSESYTKLILKQSITLNSNIVVLSGSHSFIEVIKKSDCVIRNTSTDGDSLSVKESLYLGKPVIATNAVNRPKGVTLIEYGSNPSLQNAINTLVQSNFKIIDSVLKDGSMQLINMYKDILNK